MLDFYVDFKLVGISALIIGAISLIIAFWLGADYKRKHKDDEK
jgi:hypothetical protein